MGEQDKIVSKRYKNVTKLIYEDNRINKPIPLAITSIYRQVWFYIMVHRRSPEAQARRAQRKAAREFIFKYSFNDFLIGETISRTDPAEVQSFLSSEFGYCNQSAVPCTFKGVVLSDSQGNGTSQNEFCWKCGQKLEYPPQKERLCKICLDAMRKRSGEIYEVRWVL